MGRTVPEGSAEGVGEGCGEDVGLGVSTEGMKSSPKLWGCVVGVDGGAAEV